MQLALAGLGIGEVFLDVIVLDGALEVVEFVDFLGRMSTAVTSWCWARSTARERPT